MLSIVRTFFSHLNLPSFVLFVGAALSVGPLSIGYSKAFGDPVAPQLSLSSTVDTSVLQVGQAFDVKVDLAGLDPSQSLNLLSATVAFSDTLLGGTNPHAGQIIPSILADPDDFIASAGGGVIDALFSTFDSGANFHIGSNGTFLIFTLTPKAPGSGNIGLDFVGATVFNAADPSSPLPLNLAAGSPLSYIIQAVPEPSSMLLALVGFIAFFSRKRSRQFKNSQPA